MPMQITSGILKWFESYLKAIVSEDLYFKASNDQFIIGHLNYPGLITINRINDFTFDSFCEWNCSLEGFNNLTSQSIPIIGYKKLESPVVSSVGEDINICVDFVTFVIATLLRYEEYHFDANDLDYHGRFRHESSVAFKFGYLNRPIVDEWIMVLKKIGSRIWPNITYKPSHFSLELSHDVDLPTKFSFKSKFKILKEIVYTSFISRNTSDLTERLKALLNFKRTINVDDAFNTFDFLMDVSESISTTSKFYFIAGGEHSLDADYRIDEPAISNLLQKISSRGHTIGLHPSYDCYLDSLAFKKELLNLKNTLSSLNLSNEELESRMHYLRFQYPKTLKIASDCGLKYDTSMTYAGYAGFRCGTCKPFQAYDLEADVVLPISIRPLIAMEATVISSSYMNLGVSNAAAEIFTDLRDKCRTVGGCFSLLWHNSELDSDEKRILYKKIVTEGF
jgi:hypothetical protein